MEYYLAALKKYAVFAGRARRKEYWYFVLFNFLIALVLGIIDGFLGITLGESGLGILGGLYNLAVLVPSIAIGVRRLHDTGRSGWWFLIVFVPIVGALVLIYFMVGESQPGKNQYDLEGEAMVDESPE